MISLISAIFFYFLVATTSSQNCSIGCSECDSLMFCTACQQRYDLTILGECVQSQIDHCNLYLNSTLCLKCQPTYYIGNGECVKDQSGCFKNISRTKCQICSPELILINGTCTGTFNCINYTNNCQKCDEGFSLLDKICIANSQNCQIVNRINGVCIRCQNNYTLVGYKCIINANYNPNCEIYDQQGRCFFCKQGYTLYQNNCFTKKQYKLIQELNTYYPAIINPNITIITNNITNITSNDSSKDYCKTYDSTKCIECYTNFHLQDGACKNNNPLCKQIYINGSCKSCFRGYQISGQNCSLILINNISQAVINNTTSIVIKKCSEQQIKINGVCIIPILHCLGYNLTSRVCMVCSSPYILINNQCIFPIENCLIYNLKNNCFQCNLGYFLQSNICYKKDVTCAKYSLTGACLQCIITYFLINNQCIFPALGHDAFCISYLNSYCIKCAYGYYLSFYRCHKISSKCRAFNYKDSICISCSDGLVVSGANCI